MQIHKSRVKGRRITAAEDDFEEFENFGEEPKEELLDEPSTLGDAVDNLGDQVEEMQDQMEEFEEDDPNIELDNNIEGHYIAECDKCQGVFISAVMESDQQVTKITGTCPICGKESEQYLKWTIKRVEW